MSPELDKALVEDFPNLYADRNASMQETAMCWGFSCGDGWEPLIRELSEELEPMAEQTADTNYPLKATQVKEKFGGLRFYVTWEDDRICDLIREAEELSYKTCEVCGKEGSPTKVGWIKTLCPEHKEEK